MATQWKRIMTWVGTGFAAFWLMTAMGCPSDPPNPDGGTNPDSSVVADKTSPLTCEAGTLCITVGNNDARACDILLKHDKDIASPQVAFGDTAIGQFKYRDSRLAVSLIAQKDASFGDAASAVLIKLENVDKLEVSQATCYDRTGKKLDKADITLRRP